MNKDKKNTLLFSSYDFSNSGYVLIFQSFLFPLLFISIAESFSITSPEIKWAIVIAASSALAVFSAPIVGKLGDVFGKSSIFAWLVMVSGLLAAIVSLISGYSFIILAAGFIMFNSIFELSQSLYDSFLINLKRSEKGLTSLSTFSWGFGYLGGSLFAVLFLVFDKTHLSQASTLSIFAILFLLLSLPAIFFFKKIDIKKRCKKTEALKIKNVFKTTSPVPIADLFIYWIIADCVAAVMYFAPLFVKENLGISIKMVGMLLLATQLIAFPATILMGKLANRYGRLIIIRIGLLIWGLSLGGLFMATSLPHVIAVMFGIAFVIGSTQSILRSHFASRVDLDNSGEGLGYYAVAQKSASIISPLMIGGIIMLTGSIRWSFLGLAVLIIVAFVLSFGLDKTARIKV